MKKIILLAALALSGLANAQQIALVRPGGAEVADGSTFVTNSIEADDENAPNKMRFKVSNLTEDESMYVGVKVVSFSDNVDGSAVQLCFDTCLYEVYPGLIVPNAFLLEPGQMTPSADDHFWNMNAGTGGVVTYHLAVVKLQHENEDDPYTEIEELMDFYYAYDATASTTTFEGLQKMGVTVQGTVIKNSLSINATQTAALQLFDIAGKQVKTVAIKAGSQAVDFSEFSAGVYIARFTVGGKVATVKLVKN